MSPARADTTASLGAAADSWVDAGAPTLNHGTNGYLQLDNSPVLRAYLAFDVAVPAGETITAARLSLTPIVANATGFQVRTSDTAWTETGITYTNAPAPDSTVYGTSGPLTAGVATSIDVLAALPSAGGRVSFVLDNLTSSSYGVRSREATTVSQRPQLTVTTSGGTQTAPQASFTASPTSGVAPLSVAFTDTSTGGPTSWAWDFGDGATSTAANPSHTFAAGTWTVRLTVSNAAGSTSITGTITASTQTAPQASFTASPTSGTAPLAVAFTDTSTGGPTSWAWDFGDGATATVPNPSHTFAAGTWTVRLTVSNAAGSTSTTSTITATVASSGTGVQDGSYSGAVTAPAGEKPQSKLWWNDGSWWADMYQPNGGYRIFRLDRATQQWSDTGTRLDDRANTKADTLWDGSKLYVASHVFASSSSASTTGNPTRLYRYSYDAGTKNYTLDGGFPTVINDVSAEAVVLSKDSTGTLWATWTRTSKVYINRSSVGGTSWGTPILLPAPGASGLSSDDISAVVNYGGSKTAVVWSNQATSVLWFGTHNDSSTTGSGWSFGQINQGPKQADDHISLRSLDQDTSGRIYAVIKTSANDVVPADPNAALIKLFVRDPATGGWTASTVGRVADNHTRPILMLDSTHQRVYIFMTGPATAGSGAFEGYIYMKSAPMSALSFPVGLGTPVIRDQASPFMNNVTSTKQSVTSTTGLVVLAGNDHTKRYWHADLSLQP